MITLAAIKRFIKSTAIDVMVAGIKVNFSQEIIYYETVGGGQTPLKLRSVTHRQDPDGVRFFLRCYDALTPADVQAGSYTRTYVLDYQKIRRTKGQLFYDREHTPKNPHDPVERDPKSQKRVSLSGAPDSLRRKFERTLDADPDGGDAG